MIDGDIAADLIGLARADQALRARLAASGELFGGYRPQMRALNELHADRLVEIMAATGWPTAERVGHEASDAAWLIAQHSISRPKVMRAARDMIAALAATEVTLRTRLAFLEDRIAVLEGRPQRYGTQFDWDAQGQMSPAPIEDPASVDVRRASVGLELMRESLARIRADVVQEGETRPADIDAYIRARDHFPRTVGWRVD